MVKKTYKFILSERNRIRIRRYINNATSLFYRGDRYTCNICGNTFRKFRSKGNWEIRSNAECPYCGSLERTRVLFFYLKNETDIFIKKNTLLHIAPEWSLRKIFKQFDNLHYINGDLNIAYADERVDITNIPYSENFFDYIICSHVLGHVPDEALAIKEMFRVLKEEGSAYILTLINWKNAKTVESELNKTPQERLLAYSEPDLLRLHGADFAERLSNGGFNVEIIDYAKTLGEEYSKRYSLGNGDREIIFKCTKSAN